MKRTLSLFLAMIMVLTLLPATVFVISAEGVVNYGSYPVTDYEKCMFVAYDFSGDDAAYYYFTVDSNDMVYACRYTPSANGNLVLPENYPYFTVVKQGPFSAPGLYWSESYQFKTSDGKYLMPGNDGSLVVTTETPAINWVKAQYGYCIYYNGMYTFMKISNDDGVCSVGTITTGDKRYGSNIEILYRVCPHTNMRKVEEVPATCTTDGTKEHYICDNCTEAYLDAVGCDIAYRENMVIYSEGHSDLNGDLICDNCGEKLEAYRFIKVTDAADIVPGGTYILVDEHNNVMAKNIGDCEINSVNVTPENNVYDFYKVKSSGAMVFTLKHIFGFQNWGTDVSKCYGMHIDGKRSLACAMGHFYYDGIEGAKYGMKFSLNANGTAFITSWYDETWGNSEELMHFTSYTGPIEMASEGKTEKDGKEESKGTAEIQTYYSMKPISEYPEAKENKVYLYKLVKQGNTLNERNEVVSYTVSDALPDSSYSFDGTEVGYVVATRGNNAHGLTDAISEDKLAGYIKELADDSGDTTIKAEIKAEVNILDYQESEDEPGSGVIKFDIKPIITDGRNKITISDKDLNGSEIEITLYTAGIHPVQIIHVKENGEKDIYYPNDMSTEGCKTFSFEYDNGGNEYVTFTVNEFSNIELYETPLNDKVFKFYSTSLALDSALAFKFHCELYDETPDENAYVEFTIGNNIRTVEVPLSDATIDKNGRYVFTCLLNALEVDEKIEAIFHDGDTTVEREKPLSVTDYLNKVLERHQTESDEDIKTVNLVNAISNYAHFAQLALGETHEEYTVGEGGTYQGTDARTEITLYTAEDLKAFEAVKTVADGFTEITATSRSLVLDDKTAIVLYLTPANADYVPNVKVTDKSGNDIAVTCEKQSNGKYKVVIRDIAAHMLADNYIVDIDNGKLTYTNLSALSYAYSILISSKSEAYKMAVSALYDYYTATINYLN